jgi:hypothetical protein
MGAQGSAGAILLSCLDAPVARNTSSNETFASAPGQWRPGDALLCGQSRTTIKARHFASLIGRLWVGGY